MFDGLVAFAMDRWRHDCGARRVRIYITARVTNVGGKIRSEYLPFERTNEASTLTITPKRSSSRDVGTSSYRYHTATYPLPVFRRIGERTIPYLWRACKQLRHFVGCVIVRDGLRIASFVLDGFEK
ncbi:uncharacterized protein TNCV_3649771 [Trichonephila clavipes]|nr:uncharacterized protein TNCV_3649771 [Trichonephila clavipes]